MNLYQAVLRPLLFKLPPEQAHAIAEVVLRSWRLWGPKLVYQPPYDSRLSVNMAGIKLDHPIGLAAGYDKNCKALSGLACLGFSYIVGGTVFPKTQPGNPKPRLLRIAEQEALVNAMGFPSLGPEASISALHEAASKDTKVVISIAGLNTDDFIDLHRRFEPLCQAIELNVSSPNTRGLEAFQEPVTLRTLLQRLSLQRHKPLLVKFPAAFDTRSQERVLQLARICYDEGVDGVTTGNTRPVQDARLSVRQGGLSGRPLLEDTLVTVAAVRAELGNGPVINACGGIFTGSDVLRALQAGANTIQIYSAFIYRGPGTIGQMIKELQSCLETNEISSISSIPGHT